MQWKQVSTLSHTCALVVVCVVLFVMMMMMTKNDCTTAIKKFINVLLLMQPPKILSPCFVVAVCDDLYSITTPY